MSPPASSPRPQRATAASYPKTTVAQGPPTPIAVSDISPPLPALPYPISMPYNHQISGYAIPSSIPMPPHTYTTYLQAVESSPGFGTPNYGLLPPVYPAGSYFPAYGSLAQLTVTNDVVAHQDHLDSEADSNWYDVPSAVEADSEPSRSKKAPKKTDHTPRPPNAWILYRSDKLDEIDEGASIPGLDEILKKHQSATSTSSTGETTDTSKKKNKKPRKALPPVDPNSGILALGLGKSGRGLPQADISKMISALWKNETREVREKYEKLAAIKKKEHAEKYPGYKFQPKRKAEKLKLKEEKARQRAAARKDTEHNRYIGRRERERERRRHSPYSEPGAHIMSQSLSYGDHHIVSAPRAHEGFRAYPFPIPESSLPSLQAANFCHKPYSADSAPESYGTPVLQHVPMLSSSYGSPTSDGPVTPPQASNLTLPPPVATDDKYLPNNLDLALIDPSLSDGQSRDASQLAASWCVEDGRPRGTNPKLLSAMKGKQREFDDLPEPSEEAMEQWCSQTPTAATFSNIELKTLTSLHQEAWAHEYDPSSASASQDYVFDYDELAYAAMYAEAEHYHPANPEALIEEYATLPDDSYFQFADGTEPQAFFIVPDGGPMQRLEAIVEQETGPFLSQVRSIMSPSDTDWSGLRPTTANSIAGEVVVEENGAGSGAPRHISMSAFPSTPQSFVQSLLGDWTERATSHAFAVGLTEPVNMAMGEEMMGWDDDVIAEEGEEEEEETGRSVSTSTVRRVRSKSSHDLSAHAPTPESLPEGRGTRASSKTVA